MALTDLPWYNTLRYRLVPPVFLVFFTLVAQGLTLWGNPDSKVQCSCFGSSFSSCCCFSISTVDAVAAAPFRSSRVLIPAPDGDLAPVPVVVAVAAVAPISASHHMLFLLEIQLQLQLLAVPAGPNTAQVVAVAIVADSAPGSFVSYIAFVPTAAQVVVAVADSVFAPAAVAAAANVLAIVVAVVAVTCGALNKLLTKLYPSPLLQAPLFNLGSPFAWKFVLASYAWALASLKIPSKIFKVELDSKLKISPF